MSRASMHTSLMHPVVKINRKRIEEAETKTWRVLA